MQVSRAGYDVTPEYGASRNLGRTREVSFPLKRFHSARDATSESLADTLFMVCFGGSKIVGNVAGVRGGNVRRRSRRRRVIGSRSLSPSYPLRPFAAVRLGLKTRKYADVRQAPSAGVSAHPPSCATAAHQKPENPSANLARCDAPAFAQPAAHSRLFPESEYAGQRHAHTQDPSRGRDAAQAPRERSVRSRVLQPRLAPPAPPDHVRYLSHRQPRQVQGGSDTIREAREPCQQWGRDAGLRTVSPLLPRTGSYARFSTHSGDATYTETSLSRLLLRVASRSPAPASP